MGVGLVLISFNSLFDFHINTIIIFTLKLFSDVWSG